MLHKIVEKLGGQLYANGRKANIPGPNHHRHDRSVSLIVGRNDRVIVCAHSPNDTWQSVLKYLKDENLISEDGKPLLNGPVYSASVTPLPDDSDKQAAVDRIWSVGQTLEGSLSERYIRRFRKVKRALPGPRSVLHGSAVPVSAYSAECRYVHPALMVKLEDERGKARGLELHYLSGDGTLNRRLNIPRKTIGNYFEGWRAQIDDDAEEMVIATGFFSTLSASRHFELPCVSLLSDKNLRHWRPKPITRSLVIAADNDKPCLAAAAELVENLRPYGLKVRIEVPPAGYNDFNDWEQDLRDDEIPYRRLP